MRIFIAFASEDAEAARTIAAALASERHVILHPTPIEAAEMARDAQERAVLKADFLVFLVSPYSVAPGSRSLSQFLVFLKRWRRPFARALPIVVRAVEPVSIPRVIADLAPQSPKGNLVADVSNFVASRRAPVERRRRIFGGIAAACALSGLFVLVLTRNTTITVSKAPTFRVVGEDQFVYWGSQPKYGLQIDDPLSAPDYTCRVAALPGPNVLTTSADPHCKQIAVVIAAGPFEGVGDGFSPGGTIEYVVTGRDGGSLARGEIKLLMSNTGIKLRLQGLELGSDLGGLGWGSYGVEPGRSYDVQIVNAGQQLGSPYTCDLSVSRSEPRQMRVERVDGEACRFKIAGAHKGYLTATVRGKQPHSELSAEFELVLK